MRIWKVERSDKHAYVLIGRYHSLNRCNCPQNRNIRPFRTDNVYYHHLEISNRTVDV